MFFRYLLGILLLVIPMLATWWGIKKTLLAEKKKSRSPFGEKLLRPAGEGLRLKINEIGDEMMEPAMMILACFILPSSLLFLPQTGPASVGWPAWSAVAAICYAMAFFYWRKLFALREVLRKYQLGYDGERYVAAELDSLRAKGFKIFHDFVVDWKPGGEKTNFNIDHIAVGPSGIFAIETKARRKPNDRLVENAKTFEVRFSGETLCFAGGFESNEAVKQATDNAKILSAWLTGSSSERVTVHALIVIPGWKVIRAGKGNVRVLSGKELVSSLPALEKPGGISDNKLVMIADRIEAHCRNVEGA